jgi:hypothetical protein
MTEQLQVKVSWKLGNIEMQYEGNEGFLKTELPKLFQELLEIYKSGFPSGELGEDEQTTPPVKPKEITVTTSNNKKVELSVNNIGGKIGIKKGQDLAMAASAYLALVEQKPTFSRDEIHNAMKLASHYYTENHNKSLSRHLAALMKVGYLLERSTDIFAIEGGKLKEMETILAN